MIKIKGYLNPAIITNLNGDVFAISGTTRVQVPKGTRYTDIHWIRKVVKPTGPKTYHFTSTRNQSLKYKVVVDRNSIRCDCPGYSYRRFCKHTDYVKKQIR